MRLLKKKLATINHHLHHVLHHDHVFHDVSSYDILFPCDDVDDDHQPLFHLPNV